MTNKPLGTHAIARICHVTPPTAIRWIEEGKLPSLTTGGGHRRVWDKDLIVFMRKHNIPIPPELESHDKLRILIVEDDAPNRRLIRKMLAKICPEAEIDEAVDGFEAGHKISAFLPALVILDLQLPGISGLKVCQMMRSDKRLQKIKILAITGCAVTELRKQVMTAGADEGTPRS